MSLEEIKKQLKEFSGKHGLIQNAYDGCLTFMKNSLEDDREVLGGFSIDEIQLECLRQEFIFNDYLRPTPFLRTRIGIYKKEENGGSIHDLESIGYYDLDTNMEGESVDDWLIIDGEKES